MPEGGWGRDQAIWPDGTGLKLDKFNACYSWMLRSLEAAWKTANSGSAKKHMGDAIGEMKRMEDEARALMKIPLMVSNRERATCGPEFRYVPGPAPVDS